MIPLRDTTPSRSYPVVTMAIIAVNVAVYLIELGQGPNLDRFVYYYGLVPARYSVPQIAAYFSPFQQAFAFISFMFLHGGFWHLLGNMWFLYIFGDNVEDHLGSLRYLAFYFLCGIVSGAAQLFLSWHANVPTVGASGAIAGVMGAYFLLYPRARVLTLIPIIIIPFFFEIPAYFFLALWFIMQFLGATASRAGAGGVAWWAHIGGFVFGMLLVKAFNLLPSAGLSPRVRRMTTRKKSSRLQVVHPDSGRDDANIYGTIVITPFEALTGTQKVVTVPGSYSRRLLRVTVPPDVKEGTVLRLRGMGRPLPDGTRGDLMLRVHIAF